ncbi:hypothetical protein FSP39_009606 [Pinctada imbricata]|uniref:Paired domain-containing protein n=1 Tax=Pinctada imbricata TaxID=66713 RepID=A0AA88Y8R6_PINIB|nr:hypothetical protein FSP39_009606 [Pinctada imbricata]
MASKQGKVVSVEKREKIIDLYTKGLSYNAISKLMDISKSGCFYIVKTYEENSLLRPKIRCRVRPKVTSEVIAFIEYEKWKKPSIYVKEIKDQLLKRNICTSENVPSVKWINHVLKNELYFSRKRLTVIPKETLRPHHEDLVNKFFAALLGYDFKQIHFFDEASVITTSGSRTYGHSYVGTRSTEVQRYASATTLTINVCCDYFGINYFNVLNGPSNAFEMISFFNEALCEVNEVGNPMFIRGDVIVMDNCGFHHHRQGERMLRTLLASHGVELIFQPPYSPEFNVTECVFGWMRNQLQQNEDFVAQFPELSVVQALDQKKIQQHMPSFFRRCGYI